MKNLKKIIFGCSCILFLSLSNVVFATTGTVTGKTVRIRESADSSSKIVTNAYRNDTVKILETQGDWYKVEYSGETGYMSKEFVEVKEEKNSDSTEPKAPENTSEQNAENQNNTNSGTEDKITISKDSQLKLIPNFSSTNLGIIQTGTEVKIEREFNNWVQITAGTNTGWLLKNNLNGYKNSVEQNSNTVANTQVNETTPEPQETPEPQDKTPEVQNSEEYQKQTGYVNTDTVRVRETAGGKILGNLDINDVITIVGEEGDWYKITCEEYPNGYVSKQLITIGKISSRSLEEKRKAEEEREEIEKAVEEFVQAEQTENTQPAPEVQINTENPEPVSAPAPTNKGSEIVEYAKSFLGSRYVSGGTSPSGFDCSGFTQYVYSHFGYSLARVASGQASNGVEVSRDNLMPGDLIIFQDYGRTSIGHVGIYIGDGNFIHAANPSRGVVTDNLNSNSYYNIRYVCARRIV